MSVTDDGSAGAMGDPLLRGHLAPGPRTLVDVFAETVDQAGDEPAIDTGAAVLTYDELAEAAEEVALDLARLGVGPGDRVGIRISSGTTDLYVAILGTLLAGACYVPVDADDPDERARVVFGEAGVAAVIGADLEIADRRLDPPREVSSPTPDDDAWVIFTSGSTGTPKGVAVTHRSAAAFVDAEARMFCVDAPLGVGDRVMAGLSVAFDASCEEMWLAWRYGACLVPAPRALVRSGADVGPWLLANDITVVSTVPTLVALWPAEALERVRLLIFGGEACPPELAARLVAPQREVWNTYGPTEATVVACGARLDGTTPIRIGLPLEGWDLAVVDGEGRPVAEGETGELIIGGVGLARYLDPAKDADKYAPMPTLGWERAYRSGDLVVRDRAGLLFAGRADDQIKVGGRRIELGEIDSALLALPGVAGAAAAVRKTAAGSSVLVGYVTTDPGHRLDTTTAMAELRRRMPAALVPRLAEVDSLPTKTSGKVDREALPWPLPTPAVDTEDESSPQLTETEEWVAGLWAEVLGVRPTRGDAEFFDLGGGSLAAAQLVARLRERLPTLVVADVYQHPTLASLAGLLGGQQHDADETNDRSVLPIPVRTQVVQVIASVLLRSVAGPRWLTWLLLATTSLSAVSGDAAWLPTAPRWGLLAAALVFLSPPGRVLLGAAGARLITRGLTPGEHARGGPEHLRLWLAERWVAEIGATGLACAPFMRTYARLLGATISRDVDLHSIPPVTGMLRLGRGCSIEPEVDLAGYWIDGDTLHLGPVRVRTGARVGARSTLLPGADVRARAEVAPGSAVFGEVPPGEFWSGSPAARVAKRARGPWDEPPRAARTWWAAYAVAAFGVAGLPVLAVVAGAAAALAVTGVPADTSELTSLFVGVPVGVLVTAAVLVASIWATVRLAGRSVRGGVHPVRSGPALAVWTTLRVLDGSRDWLFGLYSSYLTPAWLRSLGARIGRDVEASTVLMVPSLTNVGDQAFLADDTLIGGYELGGGWLRTERVKIGKRAFVGNSGMAAPGRKVPKASLVAVLSAAPARKAVRRGESYLGSPPAPLRRVSGDADDSRTYRPTRGLRVARACVEWMRIVPVMLSGALWLAVALALVMVLDSRGVGFALLVVGPLLVVAGLFAALTSAAAKWLLVGRVRVRPHPLWSGFIWRNELADSFVETLAVPWFARGVVGTPVLSMWLRAMGARIGRGVWCETYWLPETDLVELHAGATVNRGTVVQTHLFHDRMFQMGPVRLLRGATLGPHSVVLPASTLGRHATVGPVSLVMRGESLPDKTSWIGNPIRPWNDGGA